MLVEAYVMCWNEIETIHLTIQHYQKFCDKITILDNYSDDGTREKAEEMGCSIRLFGKRGQLDDKEYLKIKNEVYKQSKAKFVIVCDSDEILHHPDLRSILESETGNIFNTIGWDIFSNEMPVDDFLEIQTGIFTPNYCKKIIFSPHININYSYGCHVCRPVGRLRVSSEQLTMFHYRNIGGYERLSKRHEIYRTRMSAENRRWGLGCHYMFPEEQRKREWNEKHEQAIAYRFFDRKGVDVLPF